MKSKVSLALAPLSSDSYSTSHLLPALSVLCRHFVTRVLNLTHASRDLPTWTK